jgi:hypothetical protein
VTSAGLPVVGGSLTWQTAPGERAVVRQLFISMGGLRVFSFPLEAEGEQYANDSILSVRNQLTAALQQLPEGSASTPNIREMRRACNDYLQAVPDPQSWPMRPPAAAALSTLRQTMIEDIKSMAFGLDLEDAHLLLRDMQQSLQ